MSADERATFTRWRGLSPDRWLLLFRSVGDKPLDCWTVGEREMARIRAGFTEPYRFELVQIAGFYDDAGMCGPCQAFYCTTHWNISIDYALCPHSHFKSLNPYYRD